MSMILDALTRAEHERQIEKQPDLKFTNHVKPQDNKPNKVWLWVVCGLLINAVILFIIIQSFKPESESQIQTAVNEPPATQTQNTPSAEITNEEVQAEVPAQVMQAEPLVAAPKQDQQVSARPLAMEANTPAKQEVDRPLIYEAKQAKPKPKLVAKAQQNTQAAQAVKKGNVSFSSTELSADGAPPVIDKPKLLIDQGEEATTFQANAQGTSSAPSLQELPSNTRSNLKQYEVNVHVYDDDPIRRFVLINMDKYKEGDRIANNGPLVEEITANGVVIDYGNGRALLPPK